VYDTVTGKRALIPQGSRLLGQYDSQVAFGQQRLLLVWTRLIRPNGSSIILDRLNGVDTEGHAGLQDKVDGHWGRVFAGAAVSTLVGVAAALASPDRTTGSGTLVIASQQSVQDSVNQVGQQITRRNIDIQPTLNIRPGFELRVIVNKDLILRPYPTDDAAREPS
jgi:type IV secretion system protein VirB10